MKAHLAREPRALERALQAGAAVSDTGRCETVGGAGFCLRCHLPARHLGVHQFGPVVRHPLCSDFVGYAAEHLGDAARCLAEARHWLREANAITPLPPGFRDHREDIQSAEGTLSRVAAEISAAIRAAHIP